MAKGKELEKDLLALLLLESVYTTDEKACEKYDVSPRSLRRARQQLVTDPELAALVHTKKEALDKTWAETLPGAMREAIQSIGEIAAGIRNDAQMRKNPFVLEKLAGALKLCADVYYTGKVIDARIVDPNRQAAGVPDAESSDSESQYAN